jgi:CCR4-NOT transcription complex subunit 2
MGSSPLKYLTIEVQYVRTDGTRFSDFPSLSNSNAPQGQPQGQSAQGTWAPTQRHAQNTPINRPSPSSGQPSNQQSQLDGQGAPSHEESNRTPFGGNADGMRFGTQGGVGQLPGTSQHQLGSSDDFPPLGGGMGGLDRRTSIMQNTPFGAGSANLFPNLGQSRNGLTSPSEAQSDRSLASAIGDRGAQQGPGGQ